MADERVDGTATETPVPAAPEPARGRRSLRFLFSGEGWPYLLVPLIPVAMVLEFVHADADVMFLARPRSASSPLQRSWAVRPRSLRLAQVRGSAGS